MNRTQALLSSLAVVLSLANGAPAAAQDLSAGDWKFRAQIYGWFPSVQGSTAFPPPDSGGVTANVDVGDYLDALRFAFMGTVEARKGRVGLITDYIYLDFDAGRGASRDLTLGGPLGVIQIPADASADVNVRLRGWSWMLAGTYAIGADPQFDLQLLGGLRYLKVNTTVDWNFRGNVGPLPPVARSGASTTKPDVWDAIAGAKGRYRFGSTPWFAPFYVDVGTGQSDLTWQAMGGVGYGFSWGELVAAYRHLDYTFDGSSGMKDLSFSGPAVALGFRW